MATAAARTARAGRIGQWREGAERSARKALRIASGSALALGAVAAAVALATYTPTDPSLNTDAGGPVQNWIGAPGAWTADLLLTLWGPISALLLPLLLLTGIRIAAAAPRRRWKRLPLLSILGLVLAGTSAALLVPGAVNGLPAGWGGVTGLTLSGLIERGLGAIGEPGIVEPFRVVLVALLALGGIVLTYIGLGLSREEREWVASRRHALPRIGSGGAYDEDDALEPAERPARRQVVPSPEPRTPIIAEPARAPEKKRPARDRQPSLALGDSFTLPSIDLLNPAPPPINATLDKASL
ncbi:MAG TPA: DNA translocase FtsK 4TM domain-containing protein, partial [Allosphingosinicella sp.]|nr:DNA translocase FtsK 4TM domain-containing protein [Allosphingosinicella sp.]